MAESNFNKRINRYTANKLNGALVGVEDVVKLLQFRGPSWTGLYSNSWQIRVGNEKTTGTRRQGNAQPVKSPKMTPKKIKQAQKRGFIEWEISNLARSAPYAEDKKLGRFRRGFVGRKEIGNKPRTNLGQDRLTPSGSGRKGLTRRGDIGGGTPGEISSRTAELDWLPKTLKGGELKGKLRLQFKKGKFK